jgi:hypothetical protein
LPTTPGTVPRVTAAITAVARSTWHRSRPRSQAARSGTRKRASRDTRSQRSQTVPVIVWPAAASTTWRVAALRQLATLQQPIARMSAQGVLVMLSIVTGGCDRYGGCSVDGVHSSLTDPSHGGNPAVSDLFLGSYLARRMHPPRSRARTKPDPAGHENQAGALARRAAGGPLPGCAPAFHGGYVFRGASDETIWQTGVRFAGTKRR